MFEYVVLRVGVLAVHDAERFGVCDITNEVLEFLPMNLPRVDLVPAEAVQGEGDVGSCALL